MQYKQTNHIAHRTTKLLGPIAYKDHAPIVWFRFHFALYFRCHLSRINFIFISDEKFQSTQFHASCSRVIKLTK